MLRATNYWVYLEGLQNTVAHLILVAKWPTIQYAKLDFGCSTELMVTAAAPSVGFNARTFGTRTYDIVMIL